MTDKCFNCKRELDTLKGMFVCYPCKQVYYINDEKELDYYCNLGEIVK